MISPAVFFDDDPQEQPPGPADPGLVDVPPFDRRQDLPRRTDRRFDLAAPDTPPLHFKARVPADPDWLARHGALLSRRRERPHPPPPALGQVDDRPGRERRQPQQD